MTNYGTWPSWYGFVDALFTTIFTKRRPRGRSYLFLTRVNPYNSISRRAEDAHTGIWSLHSIESRLFFCSIVKDIRKKHSRQEQDCLVIRLGFTFKYLNMNN